MKRAFICWSVVAVLTFSVINTLDAQQSDLAFRIEREVVRLAGGQRLWPGFDPRSIPLAVYTGQHTYLFRHPSPPTGFVVAQAQPSAVLIEGRFPAVTSNTSTEIGGTVTATLLADGARAQRSTIDLAATAIHEAFHVYQRAHHPGWVGNEADMLLYPTSDFALLRDRRLESATLRRALSASSTDAAACWAGLAMRYRAARFAAMDSVFRAYERGTELNEGLATYVQLRAAGKTTADIPAAEFASADVRSRTYVIGPALAFLLDRLRPEWQTALEQNDRLYLDVMLSEAVADRSTRSATCALPAAETARIEQGARNDVAAIATTRTERRNAFDRSAGWRVVIEAAQGQPLWPQGFDPLNVERVDGGLLHTRFIKLGNQAGELQAIDDSGADVTALTESAGAHPLFNGIQRVSVTGFVKPDVEERSGNVRIEAPGFKATFKNARVVVNGMAVRVILEPVTN